MSGGDAPGARQLDQTPTWAVGLVCAVIVIFSILLEKILHYIGHVSLYSIAVTDFLIIDSSSCNFNKAHFTGFFGFLRGSFLNCSMLFSLLDS